MKTRNVAMISILSNAVIFGACLEPENVDDDPGQGKVFGANTTAADKPATGAPKDVMLVLGSENAIEDTVRAKAACDVLQKNPNVFTKIIMSGGAQRAHLCEASLLADLVQGSPTQTRKVITHDYQVKTDGGIKTETYYKCWDPTQSLPSGFSYDNAWTSDIKTLLSNARNVTPPATEKDRWDYAFKTFDRYFYDAKTKTVTMPDIFTTCAQQIKAEGIQVLLEDQSETTAQNYCFARAQIQGFNANRMPLLIDVVSSHPHAYPVAACFWNEKKSLKPAFWGTQGWEDTRADYACKGPKDTAYALQTVSSASNPYAITTSNACTADWNGLWASCSKDAATYCNGVIADFKTAIDRRTKGP
jgi:hypothetical protein